MSTFQEGIKTVIEMKLTMIIQKADSQVVVKAIGGNIDGARHKTNLIPLTETFYKVYFRR